MGGGVVGGWGGRRGGRSVDDDASCGWVGG